MGLKANVLNVSYIPPANQITGNYIYSIDSFQQGDSQVLQTVIAANVLNMTDITGPFTFNALCTPILQFNPNCAVFPFGTNTFTAKPLSWAITSDNPANQHSNFTASQYNLEQFSNANYTFNDIVKLTYPSPFGTFTANVVNNPLMTNTITAAIHYASKNATSTPAAPTTRLLYSLLSYNEQSKLPINTITILTASMFMNNYTIHLSVTTPSYNAINVYIPQSNYQNPSILLSNQTATTSASGFLPKINNLFNIIESSSPSILDIYLATTQNASAYAMTVYACNNYAYNYFVQVQNGPSGAQFQSQQYKMAQIPFSLPLLNGYPYQFLIYSQAGKLVYSSAIASWVSPITLYAPCTTAVNVTPIVYPLINATCTWANYPVNQLNVTCTGRGTSVLIKNWTILWQNQTSLISVQTLGTTHINSPTFSANFLFPSNQTQWLVKMTAFYGDPTNQTFLQNINPVPSPILPVDLALVAIGFLLVAVVLAYFNIALGIIIEIFALAIGSIAGIIVISASATIALIIIGVIILVGDLVLHGGHR